MDGRWTSAANGRSSPALTSEEYRTSSCRACGRRGDPARKRGGPGPGRCPIPGEVAGCRGGLRLRDGDLDVGEGGVRAGRGEGASAVVEGGLSDGDLALERGVGEGGAGVVGHLGAAGGGRRDRVCRRAGRTAERSGRTRATRAAVPTRSPRSPPPGPPTRRTTSSRSSCGGRRLPAPARHRMPLGPLQLRQHDPARRQPPARHERLSRPAPPGRHAPRGAGRHPRHRWRAVTDRRG